MKLLTLNTVLELLKEYADFNGELKLITIKKPTHASCGCCYCRKCGYHHDECVCIHNEIVWITEKMFDSESGIQSIIVECEDKQDFADAEEALCAAGLSRITDSATIGKSRTTTD